MKGGSAALPSVWPRLIAIDLDGTLLRSDGLVSERTRRALERADAAGMALVMVTGRPARHVRALGGTEHLGGLVICLNGALLYDLGRDAVVQERRLPAATARGLVVDLRARLPGICFAVEVGLDYGWEASYRRKRSKLELSRMPSSDALVLCEGGVNKLIAFHPDLSPEDLMARSHDVIAQRASLTYSGAPFLEICALEVSKASALTSYCAARAIEAREVLAFGDMPNDLPMLAWAGRGIAMANAHPTVLAMASEVTLSNDDDGVALILERLLADGSAPSTLPPQR
jgi:Cof subfamily protein (haloacid dehalogenase superfamily)